MSNRTLGERIKAHRTALGMSQEKLAQSLGVTAQAVSKWEHDQSCPDISILPILADRFGITLDELLGRTESKAICQPATEEKKKAAANWTWNWSAGRSGMIFALYIILLGALMGVNNFFDLGLSWWDHIWTLGLAFMGIFSLRTGSVIFGVVMALGGTGLLLSKYGLFSIQLSWNVVLPALVFLWGLSLLVEIFIKKKSLVDIRVAPGKNVIEEREFSCVDGWVNCDFSKGQHREAVCTELLRGGEINTSFGSFTLDFSACAAAAGDCSLEIDNNFGTLTLLFPKHLQVRIDETDSDFSAEKIEGEPAELIRGTVILRVDNSFGTLNIRYID